MESFARHFTILLAIALIGVECSAQWVSDLPSVGTFSSIRVTDLTGDAVKDIILGAGREEFQQCDTAVVAIDGVDGSILWTVSAIDQIFGSAIFSDIDKDGVDDIVIGGRSAELICISGSSGSVLWRFADVNPAGERRWFNFYNAQWIPDQSGDSIEDILISNGGDVMVAAGDSIRPPGYLLIIDAVSGEIISVAETPDGRETYMSPTVIEIPDEDDYSILLGTGGETVGGGLYIDRLSNLRNGSLASARLLHKSAHKGYVGPASCEDLTQDGVIDYVVNAVDGIVIAIDGLTLDPIWEVAIPRTESYSSPAIGYFNEDDIPDVFVSFGRGVWPKLDWSVQHMIDGATGEIQFIDSIGFYQNTSPLAIDLNEDGRDEIIMSVNAQEVDSLYRKSFYTTLAALEFSSGDIVFLTELHGGSNLSSTPWIGDLDDNGFLDIIYCHGTNPHRTYTFDGVSIRRLDTTVPISTRGYWGGYQGSRYTGQR